MKNRNWARINGIWCIFLIYGNCLLFRQGTACHGKCKLTVIIGFWPTLAVFIQRIPILGWLFQQPFIRT
ncbi:hypothetical protein Gotri_013678, partial [Gossypium trilobum]|nr:hypothetical protein [Gossypium trilobum]